MLLDACCCCCTGSWTKLLLDEGACVLLPGDLMLELGPGLLTGEVAAGKTTEVCALMQDLGVANVSIEGDLGLTARTVFSLSEDEEDAAVSLLLSNRASSISAWVTDPCLGLCISFYNPQYSGTRTRIVCGRQLTRSSRRSLITLRACLSRLKAAALASSALFISGSCRPSLLWSSSFCILSQFTLLMVSLCDLSKSSQRAFQRIECSSLSSKRSTSLLRRAVLSAKVVASSRICWNVKISIQGHGLTKIC